MRKRVRGRERREEVKESKKERRRERWYMCFFLNLSSFVYGELVEQKNGATHAYFIKSMYVWPEGGLVSVYRSEEHTSELQSR